ncbi:MAG: hypothetical protein ABIH37_00130 [archaeon]
MDFNTCLKLGKVKRAEINTIRAKSMVKFHSQAIETAKIIPLDNNTSKTIFRELYEGLREFIEAIGYLKGYKFLDHISITYFLKEILKEESISIKFDRYRKIRNGINYYGEDLNLETAKEALKQIPEIISKLKRYEEI